MAFERLNVSPLIIYCCCKTKLQTSAIKSPYKCSKQLSSDCALYCFLCFYLFCVRYVLCCTDKVIKDVKPQSKGMFYAHWNKFFYLTFWWRQKMQFLVLPHHVIRDLRGGKVILKCIIISKQKMIAAFKKSGQLRTWNVKCF